MATEEMFTSLPTVTNASMTDIICAVQGYVSPTNLGLSVQENLQQIYNLFQSNIILYNSGNPNGALAGTTYQFCWDTLDEILWICTTSGTSSTAIWTRANINSGYTTTATAAGTTMLTVQSYYWQFFTGTTTQTVVMPVTSTLAAGMTWSIVNNSTGSLTIQSSGLNTIATLASGEVALVTCILNSGTTASSWNANISAVGGGVTSITGTAHQIIASASTGAVTLSTPQNIDTTSSPTFASLTLTSPLTVGNGGIGISTTPTNGQIPIGNGTDYTAATITPGTGISISNGSGSVTVSAAASVPDSFVTDSGTATPSANSITISGSSTGLTTTGAGSTIGMTGTLAVAHGGTAVTSVTTSPTATSFAGWDANNNLSANNFIQGYATTATAAGTTTLTVSSAEMQFFTGTTTQTVTMPVVSTLVLGQSWTIINNSTGVVTVQSSGANTIKAMAANTVAVLTCIAITGTSASSWNIEYTSQAGGSVSAGTSGQLAYYSASGNIVSGTTTGTGVLTALGTNTGSSGAFILYNGALGTPTSGTLSSCSGLPISGISGLGTNVATALSDNLNGTGAFAGTTSPTFVTPTLGASTATSINFGGSSLSKYTAPTSWTPVFTFATPGNLSVSYSVQSGTYSTIGGITIATLFLICTPTFTTSSGQMTITGLPINATQQCVATIYSNGITYGNNGTSAICYTSSGYSMLSFLSCGSGTNGGTGFTTTSFSSGSQVEIYATIAYM